MNQGGTGRNLIGSDEAFKSFLNRSTLNQLSTFSQGADDFIYLQSAQSSTNLDYRASTLAVSTSCIPISKKCKLHVNAGASLPFNCNEAVSGDLGLQMGSELKAATSPIKLSYFEDADMTKLVSRYQNPIRFGAAAILTDSGSKTISTVNDPVPPAVDP